jgi:hypothetical protein
VLIVIVTLCLSCATIAACCWYACRVAKQAMDVESRAVEAMRVAIVSLERTSKHSLDTLLALRDPQSYMMVNPPVEDERGPVRIVDTYHQGR